MNRPTVTEPPIRLLALVAKGPGIAPNQRFRHEQWAPHLERTHGIELHFEPFESDQLTQVLYQPGQTGKKVRLVLRDARRRWSGRHKALEYDGVVILREAMMVGGAWLEGWLARRHVPVFYDFDDAIWEWAPSPRNGMMSLARAPWKVARICRMASAVTVGNAYLAAYAKRHNANVHIVPTTIDLDRYPSLPEPGPDAPFTVVWTGSHSTLDHLATLRPALERLGAQRDMRLRVICDTPPPPFANVPVDFVRWNAETEAEDLAPSHVGIMPLPDTPSARGKCGCKALQYMAIGRPAVVSPVGVNRDIVEDGANGLWATTDDDWVRQLSTLAGDAALRARLGAAGRQTVAGGFTGAAAAASLARIVRNTLSANLTSPDQGTP